jgi:hypothetical protein
MEVRLRHHRATLKRGDHNPKAQAAFNKYGLQDERFLVVCAEGLRVQYEQDYIDANWGDPHYLNLAPYAQGGGGMRGKPRTEETKAKLRAAQTGRKHTEEHRAKAAAGKLGKKHTEEAKAKMSAWQKGRVGRSEEAKAKHSAARKGRPWTEAQRAAYEAKKAGG